MISYVATSSNLDALVHIASVAQWYCRLAAYIAVEPRIRFSIGTDVLPSKGLFLTKVVNQSSVVGLVDCSAPLPCHVDRSRREEGEEEASLNHPHKIFSPASLSRNDAWRSALSFPGDEAESLAWRRCRSQIVEQGLARRFSHAV